MHPESRARREALRLVRRGAAASLVGGLAWAGWEAARGAVPGDLVGDPRRWVRDRLGRGAPDEAPEPGEPEWIERPLDPDVRALTDALLSQTEDYGALALRAQLLRAVTTDAERGEHEVVDFATFEVTGDVPLAVPADAEFPVHARFVGSDGEPLVVGLRVDEGRLAYLRVRTVEPGEPFAGPVLPRWPSPDEVTFWIDTMRGPQPVVRAGLSED
ncbi:hypothetical protein ACOACO_16180 [Nocardioides sp. CPCC 205120]|uniref:hypothetical protein n=1 Tax=Nocardioides sp. CPCC 205120 TaxID=3406462 RepID=UPI003B507CD2